MDKPPVAEGSLKAKIEAAWQRTALAAEARQREEEAGPAEYDERLRQRLESLRCPCPTILLGVMLGCWIMGGRFRAGSPDPSRPGYGSFPT